MDHSTAIMEDAGKVAEQAANSDQPIKTEGPNDAPSDSTANVYDSERRSHDRKRKGDFHIDRQQFGSRGGRNDGKRHKKGDMGRGEYLYVQYTVPPHIIQLSRDI